MADAEELRKAYELIPDPRPEDEPPAIEDQEEADETVLMFCPMCGELASESMPTCPACGEPLPVDGRWNEPGWGQTSREARRFRRHARWLGVFWLMLAYWFSPYDYWVGGANLQLPPMIMEGELDIPHFPVMTTILVALAAFAIVGQFWAVAVGGLLNYLILFVVVWRASVVSLCLLAISIVMTHVALHLVSSARFR